MTIKSFEEWIKDVIGIPEDFKDEYEPVELENLTELEELYQQYVDDESNFKPVRYTDNDCDMDAFYENLKKMQDNTRAIKYSISFDSTPIKMSHVLGIKPVQGEIQFFYLDDEEARDICVSTGVTLDEWKITWANLKLEEIGEEPMTQFEIDNLNEPRYFTEAQEPETTELQRLAGFESI